MGGPCAGEFESCVDVGYSVSVNFSGLCLKVLLGNWLFSKPYNSKKEHRGGPDYIGLK